MSQDTLNPNRRRRNLVALVALGAVVAVLGVGAWAATGGLGSFHEKRAALVRAHLEMRLERALTAVEATETQRAQIGAIVDRTMAELHGRLAGGHQAMHAQAMAVLTADTIDRAAIEAMRVEHLAKAEQASRVIATAIADAAEVLSPEQRKKLAELAATMHGCGGPHGDIE